MQEVGGLVGRVLLAVLAVYIVSRRRLIRLFQVPGPDRDAAGVRLIGDDQTCNGCTSASSSPVCSPSAQFSFWGNYLPRVYPVHLRGTGESFAANIGGRLIGTSFAWLTATLAITPDRGLRADQDRAGRGRRRLLGLPGRLHRQLLAAGARGRGRAVIRR